MKRAGIALAAALFALPGLARAQEDLDCGNAYTQSELTACAGESFDVADKELNKIYKRLLQRLQAADAEMDKDMAGAADALKAAQRGWIAYRDGECELAGFEMRGGTAEPMVVAGCKAELTRKRTAELKTDLDAEWLK